jgi:hypothetical protein
MIIHIFTHVKKKEFNSKTGASQYGSGGIAIVPHNDAGGKPEAQQQSRALHPCNEGCD